MGYYWLLSFCLCLMGLFRNSPHENFKLSCRLQRRSPVQTIRTSSRRNNNLFCYHGIRLGRISWFELIDEQRKLSTSETGTTMRRYYLWLHTCTGLLGFEDWAMHQNARQEILILLFQSTEHMYYITTKLTRFVSLKIVQVCYIGNQGSTLCEYTHVKLKIGAKY